jgi:hypothetical protein
LTLSALEKAGILAGILSSAVFTVWVLKPSGLPASPVLASIEISMTSTQFGVMEESDLTGTAYDQDGNPLGGVNGQLLEDGAPVFSFTTGFDGTFMLVIQFIEPGSHVLEAIAAGVTSNAITVTVG